MSHGRLPNNFAAPDNPEESLMYKPNTLAIAIGVAAIAAVAAGLITAKPGEAAPLPSGVPDACSCSAPTALTLATSSVSIVHCQCGAMTCAATSVGELMCK